MKKPIIAFDFDDVLIDVTRSFLKFYEEKQELVADYENIEKELFISLNITEDEELKLWDEFFNSDEYLLIAPVTEHLRFLEKIKTNYDLIILTKRRNRWRLSAMKWIKKHLQGYFSEILFTTDFEEDKQSKGSVCVRLGVALLIDDEPENILSCLEHNIPVIIYDRPWNRKLAKEIPRVRSLEEIEKFL